MNRLSGMTELSASQRAVRRIREELDRRHLSQRDLAERLHCSQGRVAKMLNGRVGLRLDDVAEMARVVGIPLTEVLRDRGLEFYAEMTPTEVRLMERIRQRPDLLQGVLILLEIGGVLKAPLPPPRRTRGRPLKSAQGSSEK